LVTILLLPVFVVLYAVPLLKQDREYAVGDDDDDPEDRFEPCLGVARTAGSEVIGIVTYYILGIAPLLAGLSAAALIARERRDRLLAAVINSGGSALAYYLSWLICFAALSLAASLAAIAVMYMIGQ
jgi:hypothetical protein